MKKRLLSAALAFAMVLAMIPATMVPAFAVEYADPGTEDPATATYTDSKGVSHPFYGVDVNANNRFVNLRVEYQESSDNTTKREAGNWYWLNDKVDPRQYNTVDYGIVVGTGKSGNWYPSIAAYMATGRDGDRLPSTSFTLLDDQTLPTFADDKNAPTSLTIDVNGNDLNLGGDLGTALPTNFSRLTITNSRNPQTHTGSISALIRDITNRSKGVTYSNLTVVLSNITVPSIDLAGGTNNVTLNNVAVTGDITLDGTTISTSGTPSYSAQTLNVNMGENETRLSTTTNIGGPIDIIGDNSKVVLNNVQPVGGALATLTVGVEGNGGSINVDGLSTLGDIRVDSRNGDNVAVPSVTIDGGSVGTIRRVGNASKQANKITINSAGQANAIVTANGDVTLNQGKVKSLLQVDAGKVTLNGPVVIGSAYGGTTDGLVMAATDKVTLSIKGTGSDISGITAQNGANLIIASNGWPAGRENNFGLLDLGDYKGRGVTGGTFTSDDAKYSANALWFSKDLQLVVDMGDNMNWALYGNTEMARAISDISSTAAGGTGAGGGNPRPIATQMFILGQGTAGAVPPTDEYLYTFDLINGGITWATVAYSQPTGMILPERINGYDIATWVSGDSNGSVPSGKESIIPRPAVGKNFKLYANDVATTVVKSITNVAIAKDIAATSAAVNNQNVRVSMSGTQITLSGAIVAPAGSSIATIELDLTTDALATVADDSIKDDTTAGGGSNGNAEIGGSVVSGYKVLKNVEVFYNVDTKAIGFTPLQKIDGGAIVNEAGELVLNNGTGTHYTVRATLVESAPSLGIGDEEIHATVSGNLSKRSQTDKDRIINWLSGGSAAFAINGNRAVLEAINAAQATITSDKTVENWVTTARNYVWRNGNSYKDSKGQDNGKGKGVADWNGGYINSHTGNYSTTGTFAADAVEIASRYAAAYIVPYLMVNATDMNENGTLKATLSVYYRVDVSKAGAYDPNEYYTVQPGRAMSALTGDMLTYPLLVTFNSSGAPFNGATHMHQDGKYVYTKGAGAAVPDYAAAGANANTFAINHAAANGNGLGTIELNTTVGPIVLSSNIKSRAPWLVPGVTYDDLQAAIDDTVPGIINNVVTAAEQMDTITIGGTYKETDCSITMSGVARKIAVNSQGDRKITSNTSGVSVQTNNGYNYIIQLTKDNVASGTVALTVQGTENGTATLSRKTAKVGEKVTVTLQPVNGRMPTGVTIKTNTGTEIKATATGNPNEYTFTVPSGATSITVTPTYKAGGNTNTTTEASIKVQSSSEGVAIANTDKAKPGATVTVAVQPEAGYRTMGLVVSPNSGSATAVRQGTNSFTFTVPANATAVTVTPSFDKDNGTVFTDVWSTEYFSKSVAWAVKQSVTTGTSTYTFSPSNVCTRAQMMTFLWRAAGKPVVNNVNNPFVDVNPSMGSDFYNAILWAVSKDITDGVDRTHFGPSQTVTRGQAVTFLYRYENSPAASTNTGFVDAPSTEYYARAVSWAASKGITNGKTTTTFAPNMGVSRAEAVTFLYRDVTGDVA